MYQSKAIPPQKFLEIFRSPCLDMELFPQSVPLAADEWDCRAFLLESRQAIQM
jgi:hypothetical protein